jgi:hypothetical protein
MTTNSGYFTRDNEPDGIENATNNAFLKKLDILITISRLRLIIIREIFCI